MGGLGFVWGYEVEDRLVVVHDETTRQWEL
jgi:hypothetical protein